MRWFSLFSALVLSLSISTAAMAAGVVGDYIETRSADVYTGPCFANGQVGLTGNQAIIGWKVRQGEWNGVPLHGLSVVAVTLASATLGDLYHDPYPVKALLVVDERATTDQRRALIEIAKSFAGRLLENVVRVEAAPISMEVAGHHDAAAVLNAGEYATVQTRSLSRRDHRCGNETTYYPPLTSGLSHAMPAFALANRYSGDGLGSEWTIYNKRSAFVGMFESGTELITENGAQRAPSRGEQR